MTVVLDAMLLAGPPTQPQPLPGTTFDEFVRVLGMVKWVCLAILTAGVMAIGTLLIVDNRLVDEYGPSIQAIAIKVVVGSLIVGSAATIAELFV